MLQFHLPLAASTTVFFSTPNFLSKVGHNMEGEGGFGNHAAGMLAFCSNGIFILIPLEKEVILWIWGDRW